MSDSRERSAATEELAWAQLEAYKRIDDRLMITAKIADRQYLTLTLEGVCSLVDRGWQSIVRLATVVDGAPVQLDDLVSRCRKVARAGTPFTLQIPADDGGAGLEVVAHGIAVERDTVESPDELPDSAF